MSEDVYRKAGEIVEGKEGAYKVLNRFADGGMSKLYLVESAEEPFDIHLLKEPSKLTDAVVDAHFREEAHLRRVKSNYVMKLVDANADPKKPFLILERVPGRCLADSRFTGEILKPERLQWVAQRACAGLSDIHSAGIVHGDVSPNNFMYREGKLIDLGLSRPIGTKMRGPKDETIISGTMPYLAPDQLLGENTHPSQDVYQLGIMLFEAGTGDLPQNSRSSLITRLHREVLDPREFNPDLPEGLAEVIYNATRIDPSRRYQSGSEMLGDVMKSGVALEQPQEPIYLEAKGNNADSTVLLEKPSETKTIETAVIARDGHL